jgi:adhesin transport system membrane fusion protein
MSEEDSAGDTAVAPAAAADASLQPAPIAARVCIDVINGRELRSPAIDSVMGGGRAAHTQHAPPALPRLVVAGGAPAHTAAPNDLARLAPVPAKGIVDTERSYATTLIGFSLESGQASFEPDTRSLRPTSSIETAIDRYPAPGQAVESAAPSASAPPIHPGTAHPPVTDEEQAQDVSSGADVALFRREAVRAHYGDEVERSAVDDPSGTAWIALTIVASLVLTSLLFAVFAEIEITAKAAGAVRAPAGLRPVASVIAGAVSEVLVSPGEMVEADRVLARLEGKPLRVALETRSHAQELLRQQSERASREDARLLARSNAAFSRRRASLSERQRVLTAQRRQRAARLEDVEELVRHGAASGETALAARESVEQASAALAALEGEIALLDLEATDRQRAFQDRQDARAAKLDQAHESVQEAQALLEQIEIRAPSAGRVESLLVGANAIIAAGQVLAHIVPRAAPQTVVAFLPARDTAFVRVGAIANVEVESLPVSEFGRASAKVTRISTDVARPEEVTAALGLASTEALVRVELVMEEDQAYHSMREHLRSGDRVLVRLQRRQRRIIALLFDFARKWVE